jgi:hypothetical protein
MLALLAAVGRAMTRRPLPAPEDGFGALATSRYPQLVLLICIVCCAEAPALHLLLPSLLGAPALVHGALALLHGYSLLWLLGDLRLMRESRHRASREGLAVDLGQRARAFVPRAAIAAVHVGAAPDGSLHITPREAPNLVVELSEPVQVELLVGKRVTRRLALFVDDPVRLAAALTP